MDLNKYTHVVKQKSEKWFELWREAKVTGSTLYTSKGLDTLKKQKEHYEEFIEKKQPRNSLLKFKKIRSWNKT